MIDQIAQMVVIVGSIFSGFAWLMGFLSKNFAQFRQGLLRVQEKMQGRVTQEQCRERRAALPCCTGDGTFKCPLPDAQTKKLYQTLDKLNATLDKLEKRD